MPYISIQNILHRKLMLHRNHAITLSDLIIAHRLLICIVKTHWQTKITANINTYNLDDPLDNSSIARLSKDKI